MILWDLRSNVCNVTLESKQTSLPKLVFMLQKPAIRIKLRNERNVGRIE